MKKFVLVALCAAVVTAVCAAPLLSGCSVSRDFTLGVDENGEEYYTIGYTGYISNLDGEIVIPAEYNGKPVRAIAQEGFAGSRIEKVTIPATVDTLGNAAFLHCGSLKEVVFEEGSVLTQIPRGAFANCAKLTDITLPDGITDIGYGAFTGCENLTVLAFPAGLKTIGDEAFYLSGLEEARLPDGITDIGYGAFYNCPALKYAEVGEGLTVLHAGAFGYCFSLETVTLPSTLKEVEAEVNTGYKTYSAAFSYDKDTLKTVNFRGSQEYWQHDLVIRSGGDGNGNDALKNAKKVYGYNP